MINETCSMMLNLSKLLKMFEEILKYHVSGKINDPERGRSQNWTVSEVLGLESRQSRKGTVPRMRGPKRAVLKVDVLEKGRSRKWTV